VESSSATVALGSSPSQDKSVYFLQSTSLVVNQVRLPGYTYYSGKIFTYKLDRTIVGRGAKYAGNVDNPGFSGRLFFGLSYCWFCSSSGRDRFCPAFDDRRLRLDYCSRPLCQL
jgi:hypothetical protein